MQTLLKIEMENDIESTSEEVDALLDYMDERVEQGVQPEEIMAAIVVVLALISGETGEEQTLH